MSYEISLQKTLEHKDSILCGRLPEIKKKIEPLLSYTSGKFPYYTPHDFSHSANVEENLNWIVPDKLKEEMNPYELFFLIVSAWIHDWGMIGKADENPELVREEHHLRTETNSGRLYANLNLSEHEAIIIGRISKGHRKIDLSISEYDDIVFGQNNKIRRRFLAALLRIADECDITCNRTPEIIYFTINPTDKAEEEFKKHLSISGVGQLEEKHKIYISAIAKDPKGARTLRNVYQKIQKELDSVKYILAQNDVNLDTVELKLETRGFIDKSIGFEINKTKIVDLLIGDHLYGNQDVAIRELVQNSIDACKVRETLEPGFTGKIILKKDNNGNLIIEDNGFGMDYFEAKNFLSNIGTSFYKSDLFKERLAGKTYIPISQYGIGILSCFLICDKVTIETFKNVHEACKFTVESVYDEWKYEKSHKKNPGTEITLSLNEYGQSIKLENSLRHYFLKPDISIEYNDSNGEKHNFESVWDAKEIYSRYGEKHEASKIENIDEILKFSRPNYDLIFGTNPNMYHDNKNLFLFNHGIYIGKFHTAGISRIYFVCVNLKANLIDLNISREDVKRNSKWLDFIYLIFNDIFETMADQLFKGRLLNYIKEISWMYYEPSGYQISFDSKEEFFETYPFVKSFFKNTYFPVVTNGEIVISERSQALSGSELTIYNCSLNSSSDEIDLLSDIKSSNKLIYNPYMLPSVRNKKGEISSFLEFMLDGADSKNRYSEIDLRQILLENSHVIDIHYPELIPDNIKLAKFDYNLGPLVVVCKDPVVTTKNRTMGSAYWGNILLWKKLLDKERQSGYLASIKKAGNDGFERINIINEPIVYIDYMDIFVKSILDKRSCNPFGEELSKIIYRYFNYLSYVPLVMHNLATTIIFLEVIDELEAEIAESLQVPRPSPIFDRMKPNSKIYLAYFERYGVSYIEQ